MSAISHLARCVAVVATLAVVAACADDPATGPAAGAPSLAKAAGGGKASLASLRLTPDTVMGGAQSSTATVTLTAAAPNGGAVVSLVSSDTSAAKVPASVTVPQGQTTAAFTVTTSSAWTAKRPIVTASYNRATAVDTLTIPALDLLLVRAFPDTVPVGGMVQVTAALTGPAPAGGAYVNIRWSDWSLVTGATDLMFIAQGQQSAVIVVAAAAAGTETLISTIDHTMTPASTSTTTLSWTFSIQ